MLNPISKIRKGFRYNTHRGPIALCDTTWRDIMKTMLLWLFIAASTSPSELLDRVRSNLEWKSIRFSAEMEIRRGNRSITKEFDGVGKGENFLMEFKNPEDFGVKYLKIGDQLYIYIPDIDDVVRISGDMLRQSLMGSDISYSDMMTSDPFEFYRVDSMVDTVPNGRRLIKLHLEDTTGRAAYPKVQMLIDTTRFVPVRVEYYARGGRMIKVMEFKEFRRYGHRYFPIEYSMRDLRRRNSVTIVRVRELQLDVKIPDSMFRKERLFR